MTNVYITYRSAMTQNLNGLNFDLSRSVAVNYIGGVRLPIHVFLSRCLPESEGKVPTKTKVDWHSTFMRISITINLAQHNQMLHNGYLWWNCGEGCMIFFRKIRFTCCTWGQCTLNLYLKNYVLFIFFPLLSLMIYLAPTSPPR